MSRQAREIAILHGRSLPMFRSQQEAEEALFTRRDKHLALLSKAAESYPAFEADFGPESLKTLERWYFVLYEAGAFHRIGVGRDTFETCMAMYFGETAVRDAAARWIVEEYFLARGRYEIGVQRGSVKLMLDRLTDLYAEPNNKRRQSLYRRYMKYFSASRE
jgi:hypothetical protein